MKFSIEVNGEESLTRAFKNIDGTISDLTPVWKGVQAEFFDIEKDQFQSEGAKGASGRWKELSAGYQNIKLKKYGSFAFFAGVLIASEKLYKSLTRKTGDTIEHFGKQEASFGTSLPYARKHQEGRGRLPVRKPIDPSDSQKRQLVKRLKKELLPYLKKSGLKVDETNYKDVG